jgi:hypothetical protein
MARRSSHIQTRPSFIGVSARQSNSRPQQLLIARNIAAWTVGILSSSLAFEPITGAEVLQCVQAFLDGRRTALASATTTQAANVAGDSQDEFAFEFAPMDFDDPSLRLLLGDTDAAAAVPSTTAPEAESTAAVMARKDQAFADIISHTVSPAIYRLLGNMLSGDQGWLSMVGGAAAAGSVATREDRQAREAYVARLVDCWAGCAAVLVQHRLKVRALFGLHSLEADVGWISLAGLVELRRAWRRVVEAFRNPRSQTAGRPPLPLERHQPRTGRFLGTFSAHCRPDRRRLTVAIVSHASRFETSSCRSGSRPSWRRPRPGRSNPTSLPSSSSSTATNQGPSLRSHRSLAASLQTTTRWTTARSTSAQPISEPTGVPFSTVRLAPSVRSSLQLADFAPCLPSPEVFTSISIDVSRPAAGNVALQQRKAFLISLVRDLLLSMSDFYMVCRDSSSPGTRSADQRFFPLLTLQALEGNEKRVYALFALDIVRRLRDKSGDWLNERSVRELAYWSAVADGLRAAAAHAPVPEAGGAAVEVNSEPAAASADV